MKNILFFIFIILLFATCNLKSNNPKIHSSVEKNTSNITKVNNNEQFEQLISKETRKKTREQLEEMSIYDIINLYINNKIMIYVGDYNQQKNIGYFDFVTHKEINWYYGSGGFIYIPYMNIINDSTIHIEVFNYVTGYKFILDKYVSTGKYYTTITKKDLIDCYFDSKFFINDYTIVDYIKTNKFAAEELIFNILTTTDVFDNGSLSNEKITSIQKNTEVEVIDMFYNDLKDKFPVSVRIKTDELTGWIDVNHVDFIKRDIKGTVNGIWLHNSVRNVIKNYGNRAIGGKIAGDSVPVKKSPEGNSEQLHLLKKETELYITEVSSNLEVINGTEAAWYKVYKYVENYTKDMEPADYEIIGWVFGANLEINSSIYEDSYR